VTGQSLTGLIRDDDLVEGAGRWIAALSAKAPVVLLVDDIDTAGTELLRVIWQLATLTGPKRVLVIGSARPQADRSSPPLARSLSALDRLEVIERVALPALTAADVDEMLDSMQGPHRAELAERLVALTGGNPFLISEMLSFDSLEQCRAPIASPVRIRDVVRRRLAELGRATAQLLEQAALFESDFTVSVLAEVAGASVGTVASLVDRAVAANVLQASTLTTYCFAHQSFRQALVDDLSALQKADGHRRILRALERTLASAESPG